MKRFLAAVLLVVLATGAGLGYLYHSGYFEDSATARRELRKHGSSVSLEALLAAVERDDGAVIRLLCRAGVSARGTDADANTPLHAAAMQGRWVAAQALLEHDPDIDARNATQQTPLQIVLQSGKLAFADALLERGANPNQVFAAGQPALIDSISQEQIAAVRLLLNHGADPDLANAAGIGPLYLAIRSGQAGLVTLLLEAGASANASSPEKQPVLNFLCQHYRDCGYTEESAATLLQGLIGAGADLEAVDPGGQHPLGHALQQGFAAAVEILLPQVKSVQDTLWTALDHGHLALAKRLVEKGADVNQRRTDGETALNHVVRAKRPDMIHFFLNHGADPALPGKEGQAAVPLAIVLGDERSTLTILGHERAPPPDEFLAHPVSPEFRKLFSSPLLDFYLRNTHDITPLMCAVCLDQEAVVIKLLDSGAKRYAATAPQKVFPIQLAAKRENVRMQQILIGVPHEDNAQKRHFVINLAKQSVTFFKDGAKVKTAKISSGRRSHPTEPGHYVITDKTRLHHSNIYDDAEMPYFQRFSCTAMGFHAGSLPGYAASHGCVRLAESTAKLFFKESVVGDRVTIVKK